MVKYFVETYGIKNHMDKKKVLKDIDDCIRESGTYAQFNDSTRMYISILEKSEFIQDTDLLNALDRYSSISRTLSDKLYDKVYELGFMYLVNGGDPDDLFSKQKHRLWVEAFFEKIPDFINKYMGDLEVIKNESIEK